MSVHRENKNSQREQPDRTRPFEDWMCILPQNLFGASVYAHCDSHTGTITLRGTLAENAVLANEARKLAGMNSFERTARLNAMVEERLGKLVATLEKHQIAKVPTISTVEISWQNNEQDVRECVFTLRTYDYAKATMALAKWAAEFMLTILLDSPDGRVILSDTVEPLPDIRQLIHASVERLASATAPTPTAATLATPHIRGALPTRPFSWFTSASGAAANKPAGVNPPRRLAGLKSTQQQRAAAGA